LWEHHEGTLGLRLLGAVRVAWQQLFRLPDLRSWLVSFEPYLNEAPPAVRARALLAKGILAPVESYIPTFEEAVALYRTVDDDLVRLRGLVAAASHMLYIPWPAPQAEALFEETLLLARRLGSSWGEAASLRALATIALYRHGDRARAVQLFQESLRVDRETSNIAGIADTLSVLAGLAIQDGDLQAARSYLSEAIAYVREMGSETKVVGFRLSTAVIALLEGNHTAVADTVREVCSHARFKAGGHQWRGIHVMTLYLAASSASARREPERAARLCGAVDAIVQAPSEGVWIAHFWETFETYRSAAEAQVDEPTWLEAWEEGRGMTVERALAYALDERSGVRPSGGGTADP
jgi:tetratricopeptide (TPR) repeat protein